MARSKQRKRTRRKPAPKKKSGGGGGGGGPKPGQDAKAIKTMLMGMGLFAVAAAFFLMPIAGQTPFNHLLGLFGGDQAEQAADQGQRPASAPAKPAGVKLNTGRGAKPMERVSEKDQDDLDTLIEKAKKK